MVLVFGLLNKKNPENDLYETVGEAMYAKVEENAKGATPYTPAFPAAFKVLAAKPK